jgi:hypothetical protein
MLACIVAAASSLVLGARRRFGRLLIPAGVLVVASASSRLSFPDDRIAAMLTFASTVLFVAAAYGFGTSKRRRTPEEKRSEQT